MGTLGEELYVIFLVEELIDEIRSGDGVGDDTFVQLLSEITDERAPSDDEGDDGTISCPPIFGQLIEEARDLFRAGLQDDAIARLELLARPKWSSEAECRKAYAAHMRAQRAVRPQSPAPGEAP